MRTLVASTVLAAVLAAPVLAAPSAHALDRRTCVSKAEYHQVNAQTAVSLRGDIPPSPSRQALEREWEVRGLGHVDREFSTPKQIMWVYPACGFAFDEGQIWVIVDRRVLKVSGVYRYVYFDATPHGRPRIDLSARS